MANGACGDLQYIAGRMTESDGSKGHYYPLVAPFLSTLHPTKAIRLADPNDWTQAEIAMATLASMGGHSFRRKTHTHLGQMDDKMVFRTGRYVCSRAGSNPNDGKPAQANQDSRNRASLKVSCLYPLHLVQCLNMDKELL